MRIISGKFKFYKINLEKKESFSPTSSFIRENIFNTLQPLIEWDKLNCADIFAGSGSLGLEAVSRGAKFVFFNDLNANNCEKIVQNCSTLKIDNVEVSHLPFQQFFLKMEQRQSKLDLVFIDPPFKSHELTDKTIEQLSKVD